MVNTRKRVLEDETSSTSSSSNNTSKKRYVEKSKFNLSETSQNVQTNKCGKLISIHLINFMCHENLLIDFHDRVNFLIGTNGSGKSAIITALVVGLGCNARLTSRSANIRELIKNGENFATIIIVISNSGFNAYKKEVFGNKIIIERHVSLNGISKYKIKNENGVLIDKKIETLHKILFYLNIQVNNPVFVLNQDNARTFLKDLDPSKNYEFFLKATQINLIIDKLTDCIHLCLDYQREVKFLKSQEEILKTEVLELQKKYDNLCSAEKLKDLLQQCNIEKIWKEVSHQEKIVNDINEEVQKTSNEIAKYEKLIVNKNLLEKEYTNKLCVLETELRQVNEIFYEEEQKLNELKNEIYKKNEEFELEKKQLKKLESNISYLEREIKELKQAIEEKSNSLNSSFKQVCEEIERKSSMHKKQIEDLEAMISNTERNIQLLSSTKIQNQEKLYDLQRDVQQILTKTENLNKKLKTISASKNNHLSVYGDYMKKLLELIDEAYKARRFSEKPKGPIGEYIQVKDQKWCNAVEYVLRGSLNIFLTNTAEDRKVLDQIIKKEFPEIKLQVLTCNFQYELYNVNNGMVHPPKGSRLLMHEIICADPVVMNSLIDLVHIETILLVENQDLAVQLTSDYENIPQNLTKIILLKPFIEYFPLPLFRAYSMKERQSRFLQVNVEGVIKEIGTEIKNNEMKKNKIESEISKLKQELINVSKREKDNYLTLDEQQKSLNTFKENLQELQNFEYPNEDELKILENDLIELEKNLKLKKSDLNTKEDLCKNYLDIKEKLESTFEERKTHTTSLKTKINYLRDNIDSTKLEYDSEKSNVNIWRREKEKFWNELKLLKEKFEKESNSLKILTEKAEKIGARIDTVKTKKEITDLIRQTQQKLKQINFSTNIEDVKAEFDIKSAKLENQSSLINEFTNLLNLLNQSCKSRFEMIKNLKEHMSLRLKHNFDKLLKVRSFLGNIEVNHKEQKLFIHVIPRHTDDENSVANTKALSGGERSYTTVAFLISLWSCVEHPFYMLDEYDVFTDQVNREILTKLLINEAEKNPSMQYTFLSPQDMSFIKASDLIKIHRLSDHRK